ncbi:MAG TPA: thiamine-phosphate kinase [Methylomirabilota bacterium]|nr:thiamine-phosphate kinase [Methylomirabilota bacterium]
MSLRRLGELGLIRRIRETSGTAPGVLTGIGDDVAVLSLSPGAVLLATTDLVIEDVHFRRAWTSPRDIGCKAMAVNLSDIAAKGGVPRFALVALAIPESAEIEEVDAFYDGMREAAAPHGVAIVGGDTSASPGGWMVNVTLLGEHHGTPKLRSHAKPGDAVAVTGTLGRSAAGLYALEAGPERCRLAGLDQAALEEVVRAHRCPTARITEGLYLGAAAGVHAMMDCSDGLSTDLGHICRESGVGARVRLDRLPVAPAAAETARALGADPLPWAAAGGEDYELLLTCEPGAVDALASGLLHATGTPLTVVGEIHGLSESVSFVDVRGLPVAVPSGWEHFRG